jgi:Flp pilus assembly protein TadG
MQKQNSRPVLKRRQVGQCRERRGKVLVFLAVLLPMLFGVLGLVIDSSRLMTDANVIQHAADAGATAAAAALARGENANTAESIAIECVQAHDGLANVAVQVDVPPSQGPYAGRSGFAEVRVTREVPSLFIQVLNGIQGQSVSARGVAGREASTAGAAMVVLDPNPPGISLPAIAGLVLPTLPSLHLGGLEVLGLGKLEVDGAVLVNTEWGGVDENGDPAGEAMLLRAAVTATPLLPLTKLKARDIRVVGGVDNKRNYGNFISGEDSPLRANALPVPDPLASLPMPTTASDPVNVNPTNRGGVIVVGLPLIGLPTILQPGVYDYIQVVSGRVTFQKGIYIIRGKNPLTNIPLQIIGGEVKAEGVMFYITNSATYSASSGLPDSGDSDETPPGPTLGTILPSAVINAGLLGSKYTPLNSPGSPFHGMLIFQRRNDRRILVIARDTLLSNGQFGGTIYAKWGHLVMVGMGSFDSRFVVGSMRFVNVLDCQIEPTNLLPPAEDVFLVQ